MRVRTPVLAALAALTSAVASISLAQAGANAATVNLKPLPAQVFAPYFEAYNGDNPATLAHQSGARTEALAFIQTAQSGSCTAYWNGQTSTPLTYANFGHDISTMQGNGGNAIPSFGGYGADTTNTDIADSCTSVKKIAAVYEKVFTTYGVPRIDLDIEANSLTDTAGINRRNEAVAMVEAWAAAHDRSVQFSYTMPATPSGMTASEIAILQNAIADGATVSVVNMMTFDYYIGTKQNMATDTESAGAATVNQLATLYPSATQAQLWGMLGITEMPGIDDYGADETFTKDNARTVEAWAAANHISTLSFWAIQRDNGGCVGTKGAGTCSGIKQSKWFFSHTFEPFTTAAP